MPSLMGVVYLNFYISFSVCEANREKRVQAAAQHAPDVAEVAASKDEKLFKKHFGHLYHPFHYKTDNRTKYH